MAQATLTQPAGIPSPVASKLRGLRMKINTWLLMDGVSRVLAVAAVLLFVWFLLDYTWPFDFSLRLINLIASCALLGYMIYRGLIVPFSTPVSDDALVLAVEKHYGSELGESVISAVQFSRMTNEIEVQGVSPQLVRATIDQGLQAANRVPFGSVVDTRWFTANVAIFAIGAVMLGLYAYGATAYRGEEHAHEEVEIAGKMHSVQLLGIAFDREVLLKNTPWPQDVYFTLNVGDEDGKIIIPRGDDFQLQVRVREDSKYTAEAIKELRIHVIGANGRYSEEFEVVRKTSAASGGDDADTAETTQLSIDHFLFEMPNVVEPFQFKIEASPVRGESDWYQVELVDRPTIETLTLTTTLPKYAGGDDLELPPGAGPHHILAGSGLKLHAMANKPLSQAVVRIGETRQTIQLDGETEFSTQLAADIFGKDFTSGAVSIDLHDTENLLLPNQAEAGPLMSKRPTKFSLRIKPDRGPDVMARLLDISGMVTPDAIIPFDCLIKDEYSITEITLHHQWKHEENEAEHGEGQAAIESVQSNLGQSTIRFGDQFDLGPLEIPTGSGLSFHIAAKDNNDISGPGEGKSTVFLLRVVTVAELRQDIIRRQAEQRQDFERLFKQQQDMRTETEVLRAETRDADSMKPEQRQKLLDLQKNHKLLETNIGSVARRMESIAQEMQNNRLDDSESTLLEKLQENVIQPMQELAQGEVDQAMKQLDNVRSAENKQQQRDEALDKAIAQQQRNEQKMENILKNMAKTEGYQEVVSLLYEVIGDTEKVKEMIEKERQRLLDGAFEGGGEGAEDNDE